MAGRSDAARGSGFAGDADDRNPAARVREIMTGKSPGFPKALQVRSGRVLTPRPWTKARIIIAHQQQLEHERDNGKVRLTAAEGSRGLVESPDPTDKAHLVRDDMGMLLNAEEVPNARPRQYPAACCTASGVPHDSAFDWLYDAQLRLRGVPGIEYANQASANELALVRLQADNPDIRLRDILRPRTKIAPAAIASTHG